MELDVDRITDLLRGVSKISKSEFNEQEETPPASDGAGAGSTSSTPASVKKWEDQYQTTRGKANPIDSKSVASGLQIEGYPKVGPPLTSLKYGCPSTC